MSHITITEDGREKVITDIGPYRTERDRVLARLTRIYAQFEEGELDALVPREQEIVDLVNRYNEIAYVIEQFDAANVQRANVLAGWEILKQHQADDA